MSEHTPGPWSVDGHAPDRILIGGIPYALVDYFWNENPSQFGSPKPSDVRLIAAAPELLAALKDAYDALDYAQAQVDSDDERWRLTGCCRRIKPVIDKAEGRSE